MSRPIAVLYENEAWLEPLFATLERRGLAYERLFADDQAVDPSRAPEHALLVNKVSPSSYLRGHARSIQFARSIVAHYEAAGVPVVNGSRAYDLELSKAKQVLLLARLGLPHPRTRLANSPAGVLRAARGLRFPVVVKPNVGGSGALMRRFEEVQTMHAAAEDLDFGVDGTLLVQEFLPAADERIVRLEFLDGEPLYAIRIGIDPAQGFNLCPADICQVPGPRDGLGDVLAGLAKPQRPIERAHPSAEVWEQASRIARAGSLDVCGIEYLIDARTGDHVFYDINALSNFVTDAARIVGFDPHERFVDYLAARAGLREPISV